ncbi:DNA recombination protein RmuC [Riemerella anatipestifer]|nr:DNA recombination protein RmuC [Riemerella anatipestifer]
MTLYFLIIFIFGGVIGGLMVYFFGKSNTISRATYDELNRNFITNETDLKNWISKTKDLEQSLNLEKEHYKTKTTENESLKDSLSKTSATLETAHSQIEELKTQLQTQILHLSQLQEKNQHYYAKISELSAKNETLEQSLVNQKKEIQELQEATKLQFENIANKILEEKTEKFTSLNKENLGHILKPFQEKITELKNTVHETYDKEAKERFSLGAKVKELAELNQQISEDAKKLTRALKGEAKTQGRWGEMILESILEKSGLVKNREYFLEHELKNEDNKTLYSEFSGKKMRPDAVVKYPDQRTVIIDSKVSLTAFTDLIDETDADLYDINLNKHLSSVKNHIVELSHKAYDDYGKSLDFVMMFIPSEPAYIAAMQADPNLWSFAYDRRILLLNPSNLITSLKLIADLWKREYQNQNAMAIAERGAKLYDKFVGFVENLEKVGKNIDNAKSAYNDAFGQLTSGRDNLVKQTEKLKELGVKTKKTLAQGLIDDSEKD